MTRFQATMGKLKTTFWAEPTAREVSKADPSTRVKVNVVLLPASNLRSPHKATAKLPDAALHLRSCADKQRPVSRSEAT